MGFDDGEPGSELNRRISSDSGSGFFISLLAVRVCVRMVSDRAGKTNPIEATEIVAGLLESRKCFIVRARRRRNEANAVAGHGSRLFFRGFVG